ncbi:MAG TPA: PQQ-dependent sugar dehydrogenase [Pyrinomonadaceae bacterium]|nr:PQQ-dependent sugar dehydrogenase [Pyrinomonadaceae bacterium]
MYPFSLRLISAAALVLCALAHPNRSQTQNPASLPPNVVSSSAGDLKVERLATLEFPWGLALLPDGRLLITEKPGRLRIWANGTLSGPVQGVPQVVYRNAPGEQGGLLDVEIDPDFARNQFVYLSYVEAAAQQAPDLGETPEMRFGDFLDLTDNIIRGGVVARGKLAGNQLTDVQVIWRQIPKMVGRGHFGNRIVFAPDGKLFITSGERMRFEPAQNLGQNLGKVVRINPDASNPADNPFAGKDKQLGDIWSYGHRNILAAAFDPSGRLWAFEMGPLGGDEVNLIEKGKNYGWPVVSNGDNYNNSFIPDHPFKKEFQAPVRTWTPVVSPSGALFCKGTLFRGWDGSALVGGLSSQALVRLTFNGQRVASEERIDMKRRIRDLVQAPDGSLLLIVDDKSGDLIRLSPAAASVQNRER